MDSLNQNLTKEQRKKFKEQRRLDKSKGAVPDILPQTLSLTKPDKIIVLCVRFGNKYGRDYVERLRNMVARNLSIPYEFVCLTDDQHPIPGTRTIYQPAAGYSKLWWHKVHMFDDNLPLSGRILYFDLDIVIHENIDKLVSNCDQEFFGIRDFNRKFHANWKYLNSSVMSWIHGTQGHVYTMFRNDYGNAMKLQGDQDWIWRVAKDRITFWPENWILSYKWEIRSREELIIRTGTRGFRTVSDAPAPGDCCVLVFHGEPKPETVTDKIVIDNWK